MQDKQHLLCGFIWASCQIRQIADAHAPRMPGTFSPPPRVSDPDMHHGTCVTHVPWCMPGSLTNGFLWSRRRGKTFPAFPVHAQTAMLRIWQEAHWHVDSYLFIMVCWVWIVWGAHLGDVLIDANLLHIFSGEYRGVYIYVQSAGVNKTMHQCKQMNSTLNILLTLWFSQEQL